MIKAVLFDFNGVIINDESINLQLIDEILIQENLQPQRLDERQVRVGISDRLWIRDLLSRRGRVVSEAYLTELLNRKAEAYVVELGKLEKLPLYPGLDDFLFQARSRHLKLGLVSGAIRKEVESVLERSNLAEHFAVIVAGVDTSTNKELNGYLLAVELLNQMYPELNLQPSECLAIEGTILGIRTAKRIGMQVVGVANTYPFHMIQRLANWAVDYLSDLELERVVEVYASKC
jgi:HAD superfamily hydrolase (TIGR01509 family)